MKVPLSYGLIQSLGNGEGQKAETRKWMKDLRRARVFVLPRLDIQGGVVHHLMASQVTGEEELPFPKMVFDVHVVGHGDFALFVRRTRMRKDFALFQHTNGGWIQLHGDKLGVIHSSGVSTLHRTLPYVILGHFHQSMRSHDRTDQVVPLPLRPVTKPEAASMDWSFHTLVIRPEKSEPKPHQGGTHASPRRHERRGHWRTYRSGKRVFIKPCMVGDPTRGRVEKTYEVKE